VDNEFSAPDEIDELLRDIGETRFVLQELIPA